MLNKRSGSSLSTHAYEITHRFLSDIGDTECTGIYQRVIDETEIGMLQAIMEFTQGNQSKAAQLLGITRATLRQRLTRHKLR